MFRSLAIASGILLAALAVPAALPAQTDWVAPAAEKARKSLLPADKRHVEQGEKLAKLSCAPCQGALGKGDGAAAIALTPKPADWTSAGGQSESDGELFWKISAGRGAMPSWKHLPENERWALVQSIRSLRGK